MYTSTTIHDDKETKMESLIKEIKGDDNLINGIYELADEGNNGVIVSYSDFEKEMKGSSRYACAILFKKQLIYYQYLL